MPVVSLRGGAVLAVAALLLAGCEAADGPRPGPSAPPAVATPSATANAEQELLAQARTTLQEARSYVFDGSRTLGGSTAEGHFRTVNGRTAGTFTLRGRPTKFMVLDDGPYLLPSDGFWEILVGPDHVAAVKRKAAGRWVRMGANERMIRRFFDVPMLLADLRPAGALTRGRISGKGADTWIGLTTSADPKWWAGIATTDKPYPRSWTTATSEAEITELGSDLPPIEPPARTAVVPLEELLV
ncbi:hypothetical protein ACFO0C_30895 [Actinoplanes subglobosus]|uniref:Lipoprotein n=1 Tax=Actinoplanes subglobosus TaxID=1547892 RepID=A0ABV8IYK1_9ACTN